MSGSHQACPPSPPQWASSFATTRHRKWASLAPCLPCLAQLAPQLLCCSRASPLPWPFSSPSPMTPAPATSPWPWSMPPLACSFTAAACRCPWVQPSTPLLAQPPWALAVTAQCGASQLALGALPGRTQWPVPACSRAAAAAGTAAAAPMLAGQPWAAPAPVASSLRPWWQGRPRRWGRCGPPPPSTPPCPLP